MKLTELSDWHLNQIEKLSKITPVSYSNESFEFWSGVIKLSDTRIRPFPGGFTLSERYDTFVVKEADEDSLTDHFYCKDGKNGYRHPLHRREKGEW